MNDLKQYQTDYLFLLIGTNPLPNYVAALLLAKERGHICLLHSGGMHGTGMIAENLKRAIQEKKSQAEIILHEVDESDAGRIALKMQEILNDIPKNSSVGLHYSGGTKVMSVHVYRAIEKKFPSAIFSYLDSRALSLLIEDTSATSAQRFLVGQEVEITLQELFQLHNYRIAEIRSEPFQGDLALVLAQIHTDQDGFNEWRQWVHSGFRSLPNPQQYPSLKRIAEAFDYMCGGTALPELIAQKLGRKRLIECSKWFIGEWLEEYALWALRQIAPQRGLGSNYGADLKLKSIDGKREYQFDVAAIRGYQLFALSCMASDKKEKCKEHLLEAYVRARQMGGDEARIALVCCYDDPVALQEEIEEAWFTEGRVRVFGRNDLLDLPAKLMDWFETTERGGIL